MMKFFSASNTKDKNGKSAVKRREDQKQGVVAGIDKAIFWIGVFFFFAFPVFFLPITSEFTEYPKLFLLIMTSGVLLILWLVKSLWQKRFVITKTPLDISFVLIVVGFVLTTWFSLDRNLSLLGEFNSWHLTVVEALAWVGLFYAMVTNIDDQGIADGRSRVRILLTAFLSSVFIVCLVALGSYLGLFDFVQGDSVFQMLRVQGFSLAGNMFSLIVLVMVAIVISVFALKQELDSSAKNRKMIGFYVAGMLVMTLVLGLWVAPYVPGVTDESKQMPRLDWATSWQVATSAVEESPFWGTGPATYTMAYNSYRPVEMNQTNYWNLSFAQSGTEYMTWLTTMGLVGLVMGLVFIAQFLLILKRVFGRNGESINFKLRGAWIVSILIIFWVYFFGSSTTLTTGVLFICLIIWMLTEKSIGAGLAINAKGRVKGLDVPLVEEVVLSLAAVKERFWGVVDTTSRKDQPLFGRGTQLMPWLVAVPLISAVLLTGYYTVMDVRSNIAYTKSIRAISTNKSARDVYEAQQDAVQLNPRRDVYHRAYANTNISLSRLIADQVDESTDESTRNDVVSLIQQAIREARVVTEVLGPYRSANWQLRGNVYKNLLGVAAGADQWAVDAYSKAISLAPTDPRLRINLGSLFLSLAVRIPVDAATQDQETADTSANTRQNYLAQAERSFVEATNLKPDYANAYFNLSAVYKQVGRFDLALVQLEKTRELVKGAELTQVNAEIEAVQVLLVEQSSQLLR